MHIPVFHIHLTSQKQKKKLPWLADVDPPRAEVKDHHAPLTTNVHKLKEKERKKKYNKKGKKMHLCANEAVIIEEGKKEGFVYDYAKLEVAGLSSLHVCSNIV